MESLLRFTAPPSQCGYLPDQLWRLEYEYVASLSRSEYMERLLQGWRRFGSVLFRPRCQSCAECRSLRVSADRFRPNRSQRRVVKANHDTLRLFIESPSVTPAKLDLYDRYHAFRTETRGWPLHGDKDVASYATSFVDNPFPSQEWCYYLGEKLLGVGYVDELPAGLSAIYFFYDPAERQRSLGNWHVLSLLEHARDRGLPHLYLGYYIAGCPSMRYKSGFVPNQLLGVDGQWRDFQT
jgi:leucyl-tRNA---protein transferase